MITWLVWLMSFSYADYTHYWALAKFDQPYQSEYNVGNNDEVTPKQQWEFFYWMMEDVNGKIEEMKDYDGENKDFIMDILQEVQKTLGWKLDVQEDQSDENNESNIQKTCPTSVDEIADDDLDCLFKLIE